MERRHVCLTSRSGRSREQVRQLPANAQTPGGGGVNLWSILWSILVACGEALALASLLLSHRPVPLHTVPPPATPPLAPSLLPT